MRLSFSSRILVCLCVLSSPSLGQDAAASSDVVEFEEFDDESAFDQRVQVAPSPVRWDPMDRSTIESEIDALEDERDRKHSLGGPIATMAVGGGLALGGIYFLLTGAFFRSAGRAGGYGSSSTENTGSTFMTVGTVGLVGGGIMSIAGGAWLGSRIKKRRPYNQRIDDLEHQLDAYGSLHLQPLAGQGTLGLSIAGSF